MREDASGWGSQRTVQYLIHHDQFWTVPFGQRERNSRNVTTVDNSQQDRRLSPIILYRLYSVTCSTVHHAAPPSASCEMNYLWWRHDGTVPLGRRWLVPTVPVSERGERPRPFKLQAFNRSSLAESLYRALQIPPIHSTQSSNQLISPSF